MYVFILKKRCRSSYMCAQACLFIFFLSYMWTGWLELHPLCHPRLHSGAGPIPLSADPTHQPNADVPRHSIRCERHQTDDHISVIDCWGGETGFGLNHITVLFFWLALFSGGSATSSPAMLGIRRHSSNYQRAQSSMQLDTYYGDNSLHKRQYTGLWHSSGICTLVFLSNNHHFSLELYLFYSLLMDFSPQGQRRKPHISLGPIPPSQERIWEDPR